MRSFILTVFFLSIVVTSCKEIQKDSFTDERMEKSNQYTTIDGKVFSLEKIKEMSGVFIVVSATCPVCYSFYGFANDLSAKTRKDIVHVAILTDSISVYEEYKKGEMYKIFGFLNENWIVFPNKDLATLINKDYNFDHDGIPYLFLKQGDSIISSKEFKSEESLLNSINNLTQK